VDYQDWESNGDESRETDGYTTGMDGEILQIMKNGAPFGQFPGKNDFWFTFAVLDSATGQWCLIQYLFSG
jgi:hypothetical protein